MTEDFSWIFQITNDVVDFNEATIQVVAPRHKDALRKIRALEIPNLERYDDIEKHLKLVEVYEVKIEYPSSDRDSVTED